MNHLEKTQETYRQIAADYAQAQQNRGQLVEQMAKFVSLLPPGGTVLDVGCGPGWDTAAFHIIDGWQEEGRRDTWLVHIMRKKEAGG
jgi:ubiquinone/menaquinone biosynthesis C-methylase UbiE